MNSFLDKNSREHLRKAHRREKNRRRGDRIKAILLSDKGWTYKSIAEALLLDEETVSNHVLVYITNPDAETASKIAHELVSKRLAACAGVSSCSFEMSIPIVSSSDVVRV